MWQFIKYVFATIVGLFIFSLLGFFLFIGMAAALGSSEERTTVESNSVLKLNLNSQIQEVTVENPFAELSGGQGNIVGLLDIKSALANAKLDDNIKGVYLNCCRNFAICLYRYWSASCLRYQQKSPVRSARSNSYS